MKSQREISLKNKSGIKTYNNKLLNFQKFQLSKVITLKPYLVDKLLGTSEEKGDCEADERKRVKEKGERRLRS